MTRSLFPYMLGVMSFSAWSSSTFGTELQGKLAFPTEIDKPAVLTIAQLREGISRQYGRIHAIEVTYQQNTRVFGDRAESPAVIRHFAFKGEKRFLAVTTDLADTSYHQAGSTYAFDETRQQDYHAKTKSGVIAGPVDKQNVVDVDGYVYALAIPLTDAERAAAATSQYFLPYALGIRESDWEVEPKLMLVGGAECHVVVSKYNQRIWIDPAVGFGIRFRERFQPLNDKPRDEWPLETRYVFRDFEEIEAGLWLPKAVECIAYAGAGEPKNRWNHPAYNTLCRVSALAVNDHVSDSLFVLSFPPGTVVQDIVRKRVYRVGNANEELDVLIADIQSHVGTPSTSRRRWLLVSVLAISAAMGVIYILRVLNERRSARSRDLLR